MAGVTTNKPPYSMRGSYLSRDSNGTATQATIYCDGMEALRFARREVGDLLLIECRAKVPSVVSRKDESIRYYMSELYSLLSFPLLFKILLLADSSSVY
jgi:hypothetical protein